MLHINDINNEKQITVRNPFNGKQCTCHIASDVLQDLEKHSHLFPEKSAMEHLVNLLRQEIK